MSIILNSPTAADICRQILQTTAAHVIKYIDQWAVVNLIDELGLQNQYKTLTRSHKDHDQETGIHSRNPRRTQAARAWSRSHTILNGQVGVINTTRTIAAPPPKEKRSTKLAIIET
jgi:hypothetical protein